MSSVDAGADAKSLKINEITTMPSAVSDINQPSVETEAGNVQSSSGSGVEQEVKSQCISSCEPSSQRSFKGILIGSGRCAGVTLTTSENDVVIEVCSDSSDEAISNKSAEKSQPPKNRRSGAGKFKCPHCSKTFLRTPYFYAHLRNKACLIERKRKNQNSRMNNRVLCKFPGCHKSYVRPELLAFHVKQEHSGDKTKNFKYGAENPMKKCPINQCSELVKAPAQLRNHLIYDHDINIQLEKLSFNSEWEFQKWRLSMEKETACKYKIISMKKHQNLNTRIYNCCEIEQEDSHSNRMCPSKIEVRHDPNREVTVVFYKTHLGHRQKDIVVLSRTFIDKIAGLLRQGITADKIIEKIEQNEVSCSNCQNLQLVSKEHIFVIARDFNIPITTNDPPPLVFHSTVVTTNNNIIETSMLSKATADEIVDTTEVKSTSKKTISSKGDFEAQIQKKIQKLSHLVRKGISSEKCQELEKCVDLALSVLQNKTKVIVIR